MNSVLSEQPSPGWRQTLDGIKRFAIPQIIEIAATLILIAGLAVVVNFINLLVARGWLANDSVKLIESVHHAGTVASVVVMTLSSVTRLGMTVYLDFGKHVEAIKDAR